MGIKRACVVCGRPASGTRCPEHQVVEDQRRASKSKAHGLQRGAWQRTRKRVLARDGGCCRLGLPGCTVKATSVHRLPEFGTFHDENLAAYVSACASCHGKVDAPRARR